MRRSFAALVALAALVVAGCAGANPASDLEGASWALRVYQGAGGNDALAVLAPRTTATFDAGSLAGSGGCNDYTASYEVAGSRLAIGPVAATQMACPGVIGDQEQVFFAALARVAAWTVEEDVLTLSDGAGRALLVLSTLRPLPLVGTPWEATSVSNGTGGVLTVSPDVPIFIVFREDSTVVGFTGCNRYAGPYRELRGSLTVGPLTTTPADCPAAEGTALEAAFLAALDRTTTFVISGAVLDLRDRDGDLQATFRLALPQLQPDPTTTPAVGETPTPAPTASPTPEATPAPTPAPTATPAPTPAPTATPAPTPAPTAAPTGAPTAAPTPSPTPVALATCPLPAAGVTVSYPETWFTTEDVPELTCVLYGPEPVTVDPVTRQTNAKVSVVASISLFYDDVVAGLTNRSSWAEVTTKQTMVSTLPATVILGTSTGTGSIPAGITQYSYVVDRGGLNGVVLVQTAAREGATDAATNRQVVDLIASKIVIDARPK